ncbi:MAG: hypothetical protein JWQ95_5010 [Sphaerisporangium sp.]|jgi:hypothetical protein|nr:hypothetical protein [Sphaerisporangium sp.]
MGPLPAALDPNAVTGRAGGCSAQCTSWPLPVHQSVPRVPNYATELEPYCNTGPIGNGCDGTAVPDK